MRYIHYFDDGINKESVQDLMDTLIDKESVDLYFSTDGGEITPMIILTKFLNNHPDLNIFLTESIASCGAFILTDCKNITLTEELDYILIHQIDRPFGGKFRKQDLNINIMYKQLKAINAKYEEKFRYLGLSEKQLKQYSKGLDVIIYREDFKKLQYAYSKE